MSAPALVNPPATAPSGTFSAQVTTSSKTGVQSRASRVQEVPRGHAFKMVCMCTLGRHVCKGEVYTKALHSPDGRECITQEDAMLWGGGNGGGGAAEGESDLNCRVRIFISQK